MSYDPNWVPRKLNPQQKAAIDLVIDSINAPECHHYWKEENAFGEEEWEHARKLLKEVEEVI